MSKTKKTKSIKASEILAHVIKTKSPFPIPSDFREDVFNDCIPDPTWVEDSFVSVTKAWFARFHGVSQSQVGRWLDAGLPTLDDGRLLLSEAEHWLRKWRREDPERRCKKVKTALFGMSLEETQRTLNRFATAEVGDE